MLSAHLYGIQCRTFVAIVGILVYFRVNCCYLGNLGTALAVLDSSNDTNKLTKYD